MASTGARRGVVAALVVAIAATAAIVGAKALWRAARSVTKSDGCSFDTYHLDLGQSQVASTMVSVVIKRGLPERAAVLIIGAGLQESKLRNIPAGQGDRDSVGVLQQRPSQGWGTAAQLSDITYATGRFLDALVKLPNWQTDSMAVAIQDVQISADGQAYAKHEAQATSISNALLGKAAAGVSCSFGKPSAVASANTVAGGLTKDLPVQLPAVAGNEIQVKGASWATAAWFITHADQYGIDAVRYNGKEWTRSKGWHDQAAAGADQVVARMA
jgi:hypothetical protein